MLGVRKPPVRGFTPSNNYTAGRASIHTAGNRNASKGRTLGLKTSELNDELSWSDLRASPKSSEPLAANERSREAFVDTADTSRDHERCKGQRHWSSYNASGWPRECYAYPQ